MATKNDLFDKFKNATLGDGSPLSGALSGKDRPRVETPGVSATPSSPVLTPVAKKVSKNSGRKQVSFHLDEKNIIPLGQLKFEKGCKYDDLYNEAVADLLTKYGK